ncbi:hypothetical protein F5Y18DRAFT_107589 [Xylariaceae sp. FL1019]|nr:hypothetical protein F5Y18DRAFT_107589 [Xylariaceae sp. FL1019]
MLGTLRTYNISLITLDDQLMFRTLATIIASLFSKNIRPISQAINDAASAREIDVAGLVLRRGQASRAARRRSEGSTLTNDGPRGGRNRGLVAWNYQDG